MEDKITALFGGGKSSVDVLHTAFLIVMVIGLLLGYITNSSKLNRVADTKTKDGSGGGIGGGGDDKQIDGKVTLNPQADAAYLVNCLRPNSTPLEILYAIATTPDTVAITTKQLAMANDLRKKKLAHLAEKEKEASHKSMDDLLVSDGWAEDDEDDPAAAAAKKAKEEKEKESLRLAKATGKDTTDFLKMKLEGVDEGVLGQEWVHQNLIKIGAWPPPSFMDTLVLRHKKFSINGGKAMSPLEHPGVQRALIMTMGRLHAKELNTHPDLIAAGPKGLIDPTYFSATMEYRQRVGQVLEGSLRMACTLRSYRLASSILDAIVMFKIGLVDVKGHATTTWFNDLMTKQYGAEGVPKLIIGDKFLGVPAPDPEKDGIDEENMSEEEKKKKEAENMIKVAQHQQSNQQVTTTDEKMALEMQITRQHAESFTKEKLVMAQKQGIPPQIAMQAYREAWFILVRARKIDETATNGSDITWNGALGDKKYPATKHMELLKEKKDSLYEMLDSDTVNAFTKEFANPASLVDNRIVIGWPFVISNVAQKMGKVKIHLPPPVEPGRYEFIVTIKSQEFVGVEEEFALMVDVAQGSSVVVAEGGKDDASESKKDK